MLSFAAALSGLLIGLVLYRKGLPTSEGFDMTKWAPWRKAAANQFGYDGTLVRSSTEGGGEIAHAMWKYIDAGFIDKIVNGVGIAAQKFGGIFRAFQTGYVRSYALMMLFGTVGLIGYIVYAMTRVGGTH
jgi:NADH-quinone oxidoreductase subunit L